MTVEVKDKVEDRESWGTRIIVVLAMILVTIGGALNDTILIPIIFYFIASFVIRNLGTGKIAKRYNDMNDGFVFSYGVVYLINQWLPLVDVLDSMLGGVGKGVSWYMIDYGFAWLLGMLVVFAITILSLSYFSKKYNKNSHWHK